MPCRLIVHNHQHVYVSSLVVQMKISYLGEHDGTLAGNESTSLFFCSVRYCPQLSIMLPAHGMPAELQCNWKALCHQTGWDRLDLAKGVGSPPKNKATSCIADSFILITYYYLFKPCAAAWRTCCHSEVSHVLQVSLSNSTPKWQGHSDCEFLPIKQLATNKWHRIA